MAYRDDVDALQAKKELLEEDLARIAAQKEALERIARDEKKIASELDGVQRKLDERRKKLPLLSNLKIASPCNAAWSQMSGDERVRFCGSCKKNVYNISSMTGDEAERLISEREGELCLRFYQRKDGTIITADCSVGMRKKRVRWTVAGVALGVGVMASSGAYAMFHEEEEVPEDAHTRTMGAEEGTLGPPPEHYDDEDNEKPKHQHPHSHAQEGTKAK
jgi:hypothetical protein